MPPYGRYQPPDRLICREKLDTVEDVQGFIDKRQGELEFLQTARQKCYNRLRRCNNGAEIVKIKTECDRLTATMALCRKDIKAAGEVLTRCDRMKENLRREQEMQAQRMGHTQDRHRERSVVR